MSDTQWPRFEVFEKDREGRPHQNVGSVHAVDAEMAIQNARDVFARRPRTVNLWVVPADQILAKTVQEIEQEPVWRHGADPGPNAEPYYVFQKSGQRRGMVFVVHVGEVEADTAEQALQAALQKFPGDDVYVWWVFPASAVQASNDDDIDSLFTPALDKHYRMPNEYRTITQMMDVRSQD